MHRRCCWPPDRLDGGRVQAVLHFVPERRHAQRLLRALGQHGAVAHAVQPQADGHILGNGHRREGIGFLEDHAHAAAHDNGFDVVAVNVLAEEADLALHAGGGDQLVHPVEGAQEGGFAATAGADNAGDRARRDVQGDVLEHVVGAKEDRQVAGADSAGGRVPGVPPGCACGELGLGGACKGGAAEFRSVARSYMKSYQFAACLNLSRVRTPHPDINEGDQQEQDQRAGPGLAMPIFVGRNGVVENLQGQRGNRVGEVVVPEAIAKGGKEQAGRFRRPRAPARAGCR